MTTLTAPPAPAFVADLAHGGDAVAVSVGGTALSYRALAARVAQRADELGGGRRLVMIGGDDRLETLLSYLGALHGGHVPWLVPAGDGPAAAALRAAYAPDVVVTATAGGARIEDRERGSRHRLHPELALLLGTSGSTGAPRLVRLSRDNLDANAHAIADSLGIGPDERALTTLPMHYCYGLSVVNSHLARGAALVLTDHSVADPAFWRTLREEGGTSFAGVPHTFDLLDRCGFAELELPSLRYVTQAGGRLAPETVRRYAALGARRGWRLVVMYGQTEATARMAYLPPERARDHPAAVGVPVPGGGFTLRPVPEVDAPGVGELVYRGPNVMLGYAEGPDDLARGRTVHELATGDLGRLTPAGLYEVVGRRSRFVKLYGLRIDLGEVERILERAGVLGACTGTDERLAIAVTGGADPRAVARLVSGRLGLPAARVRVTHHHELPLLPSGKPDHAAVLQAAEAAPPPPPPAPGAVAAAFCAVLDRPQVAADDSFASLGGDSLSYVEMSLALEEVLGDVPPGWPELSVAELSRRVPHRGRLARVETNVVLRAAAVVLVVASHMTAFWPAGGAHLLFALAGWNHARFGLAAAGAPGRVRRSLATAARIAVPTSAWIGLQMLLVGGYSVGALLLVNNYTGSLALTERRWEYWYIEALVQSFLVLAALFAIPAVRRAERRRPFAFAMALLGLGLAVSAAAAAVGADANAMFRPHTVVWLFLLGWAAQRATTPAARAAVSGVALVCVPLLFAEAAREAVIVAGLVALVWLPVVPLPRPLARPLGLVAAASLYIYLTHWQVWPELTAVMPVAPALVLTVTVGVAAWWAVDRATVLVRRLRAGAGAGPAPSPVRA